MQENEESISSEAPLIDPQNRNVEIKVYKTRWYILAIFSLLGILQGMIWNSLGPISNSLLAVFCPDWTEATLALMGNWGNITYILAVLPFLWHLETQGLRPALLLAAVLMLIGTALRCIPVPITPFTVFCHICAILNGVSGIVVFSAPSALSSTWFPPNERTTATGIALVFNNLGNAASFLAAPAIVPDPDFNTTINGTDDGCPILTPEEEQNTEGKISILMYFEAALVLACFLSILVYFPTKPKRPPSITSSMQRLDFLPALKKIFTAKDAIFLTLSYSLFNGVVASWYSVMNITFRPLPLGSPEDTDKIIGYIGLWSIISNCVTSIVVSRITDMIRGKMKLALIIIMFLGCICWSWLALICLRVIPFSLAQLYAATILSTGITYSAGPIFFEFCAEIVYPVPEGVVGGFLTTMYNTFGMLFLFLFYVPRLANNPDWIPCALVASTGSGLPLVFLVKEEYNRAVIDDGEQS